MASRERASLTGQAGRGDERVEQRRSAPTKLARAWSSSPTTTAGPSHRSPRQRQLAPSSVRSSVVFPAPFGPTIATRSAQRTSRSTGPRRNVAPLRPPRPESAHTTSPLRRRARDLQPQVPALPRLLDDVEPFERLLGHARLRRELLGAIACGTGGRTCRARSGHSSPSLTPCTAHWRCRARPLLEPRRARRGRSRSPPRRGAARWRAPRGTPATHRRTRSAVRECSSSSSTLVIVRSRNARSWLTTTIPPPADDVDEALEPFEPVEVEVVRRLVEQEDVEAAQQDRRRATTARPDRPRARVIVPVEEVGVESERRRSGPRAGRRSRRRRTRGSASSAAAYASSASVSLRPSPRLAASRSASAVATPVRRARYRAHRLTGPARSGSCGR